MQSNLEIHAYTRREEERLFSRRVSRGGESFPFIPAENEFERAAQEDAETATGVEKAEEKKEDSSVRGEREHARGKGDFL